MNVFRWLALTVPLALAASAAAGPPEPPHFPVRQVLPGPPGPIEMPPPAVEAVDAAAAAAAAAAVDEAVESSGGPTALPGAAGSAVSEALSEAEAAAAGAAAVSAQETDLTGVASEPVPNAGAVPAVPAEGPPATLVPAGAAVVTASPGGTPAPETAGAPTPAAAPASTRDADDADDEAVSATAEEPDPAGDEPAGAATNAAAADAAATEDEAADEAAAGSAIVVPAPDPVSPSPATPAAEPPATAVASPAPADVPIPADAETPAHVMPPPSAEANAPEAPATADAVPAAADTVPAATAGPPAAPAPVATAPASPAPVSPAAPVPIATEVSEPAEIETATEPAEAAAEPTGAEAAVGPTASDAGHAPAAPDQAGTPETAAAPAGGEAAEPARADPVETGIAAEPSPPKSTEPIATEASEPAEVETATEPAEASGETPSAHAAPTESAPAEAAAGDHGEAGAPPPPRAEALPAAPLDPETSPVRLVRTLQQLQDQMARGSTLALKAQRGMLNKIEAKFAVVPPETWQEPANAHALVTFVLSGGNPAPLRAALSRTPLPPIDERLMRGVLAYTDGREKEAAEQFAGVDPLSVPASMGAQVALAKAALAVDDDTALAIGLLDTARLLAPGTLAEEAALRREIFVVSQLGDVAKFELLSTQYLNRFRHSVYAGNFRQRFAAALTRMDFVNDPKEFGRLDTMISDLDDESRLEIYLLVARAAVNRGRTSATILAAERAQAIAKPGDVAGDRARLYRAASLVVTAQGLADGMAELAAIDPTRLPKDDAALHQAATSTAQLIINAPDIPAVPTASDAAAATADAGAIPGMGDDDLPEVAGRAQDALATVDDLLKRSTR